MHRRGVTLLEMIIVVSIVALMAGLMYPSISSGLEGIRLNSTTDEIVAFLNGAVERANRRSTPIEVTLLKTENALVLRSTEPGFLRRLDLPAGIILERVLPEIPGNPPAPRAYMIYPGGSVPRIGVQIANPAGHCRLIRIDPITGSPLVERF